MLALSIRQPYAELRKTRGQDGGPLELNRRAMPTKIIGRRFRLDAAGSGYTLFRRRAAIGGELAFDLGEGDGRFIGVRRDGLAQNAR